MARTETARVLIAGSAAGLGMNAARELIGRGHEVVLHARDESRLDGVRGLRDKAFGAVFADLSDLAATVRAVEQAEGLAPSLSSSTPAVACTIPAPQSWRQ